MLIMIVTINKFILQRRVTLYLIQYTSIDTKSNHNDTTIKAISQTVYVVEKKTIGKINVSCFERNQSSF